MIWLGAKGVRLAPVLPSPAEPGSESAVMTIGVLGPAGTSPTEAKDAVRGVAYAAAAGGVDVGAVARSGLVGKKSNDSIRARKPACTMP
jgi:hypothetical protein